MASQDSQNSENTAIEDALAPTGYSADNVVPDVSNDQAQKREPSLDDELLDPEYREAIQEFYETRNETLKDVKFETVRDAWFTTSHLLLPDNSKIADMGCGDGLLTFCMAALNPQLRFIGIDKNKRNINKARETYRLHNLEFKVGDISSGAASEGSLDAIVNNNILHTVYSGSRYNERIVSDTLAQHFKWLKNEGIMFIRDYARPPPEEFVQLELKDKASDGDELTKMSDVDLLIWYSEHARPRQDPGMGGFFLEELPPKRPYTRLFRLPYKWAYEFIMRKDQREKWEKELPLEYTFFTQREFRKELRALGARVLYSGPHWDENFIAQNFTDKFRLYHDNGRPLGNPPTGYLALAQKMQDRKSLVIAERRPSHEAAESALSITAMRNEKNGQLVDVVQNRNSADEIMPYRITEEGRLKIYLHDGRARAITNSVLRNGSNIDGKRWSGHMVETIGVNENILTDTEEHTVKSSVLFARDYLGLRPQSGALLTKGPHYYPSPDYIDERIQTYYLHVDEPNKAIRPTKQDVYDHAFVTRGKIREFDAQQVLNAITVGVVPNARLELQILSLYEHLKLRAETWTNKEVAVKTMEINSDDSLAALMRQMSQTDHRFRETKGTAGQLRLMKSIFVEEGQAQGSTRGLSASDLDFVISDEKTVNTAVVIPLTSGVKKDIHAGFQVNHMPVPQRHEGNSATFSAPSFEIPAELTDIDDIKEFIGKKFGVPAQMVVKLGESYFNHVGITPQRIYPFAVAAPPDILKDPYTMFMPIEAFRMMWGMTSKNTHFMTVIARAWNMIGDDDITLEMKSRSMQIRKDRMKGKTPDWSIPSVYEQPPGIREVQKIGLEPTAQVEQTMTVAPQTPTSNATASTATPAPAIIPDAEQKPQEVHKRNPYAVAKKSGGFGLKSQPNQRELSVSQKDLADAFEKNMIEIVDALDGLEKPEPKPDR